jgi:hypothetical protein
MPTSFLHEGEQVVQELFPLLVVAQLVKLKQKKNNARLIHHMR